MLRIGGGFDGKEYRDPEEWLAIIKEMRYSAVYCPIDYRADRETRTAYKKIMEENDLVLGEVGAWKNPLDPDPVKRKENIDYIEKQLELAEEMGARCCVDIAGARGAVWDGAYEDNYSEDTYVLIVDTIREIIDAVKPRRTFYSVEPMPWMCPDSPDAYLKLLKDVDRAAFGVHMDYTNMINCPERFLKSDTFLTECFTKLGPYIKSVHAKDLLMEEHLPCVLKEVRPGKGSLNLKLVMKLSYQADPDMTVYAEHLSDWKEYAAAAEILRKAAMAAGQ